MRVSEDTRKIVLFLGWQEPGPVDEARIDPKGTGFLINGDPKRCPGLFLVTAGHVAKKLVPPFVMRVNKKGGGAGLIHIERPEDIHWCHHPVDKTADIAVAPVSFPSWVDMTGLRGAGLFDDAPDQLKDIDAGDNAFVIGLFHLHHGEKKNVPVVFRGSVALLPSDELILVDGQQVEGYLVQTNAISGFSGAPVFATRTIRLKSTPSLMGASQYATLIGVWSSSWKVKNSEIVSVQADEEDVSGGLAPLGMGIVVPASKLLEILDGVELKQATGELVKRLRLATFASLDVIPNVGDEESEPSTTDENPRHREDFNSLLGVAARAKPQGDRT